MSLIIQRTNKIHTDMAEYHYSMTVSDGNYNIRCAELSEGYTGSVGNLTCKYTSTNVTLTDKAFRNWLPILDAPATNIEVTDADAGYDEDVLTLSDLVTYFTTILHIPESGGEGGGGGESVEWGDITGDIDDNADLANALAGKQDTLTAGTGISIDNNVISATGGRQIIAGEFLEEEIIGDETKIKTVHSDRITPYANYLLSNSNGTVWCPVDVEDMVNGVTKIYSDEECATEIGVITNHSYNPNNPLDVEVSIGGVTEVYVIDPTKIPKSLATTAAVIQANLGDTQGIITVDLMRCVKGYKSPTEIAPFSAISNTDTTITLSSTDGEKINQDMTLAVRFNDETYKIVAFKANGGTTIEVDYDLEDESFVLGSVHSVASTFDTIQGQNGMHLTPYGYKAIAQFVASEVQERHSYINGYKAGVVMNELKTGVDYRDESLYNENGTIYMTPTYSSNWKRGGRTGTTANNVNASSVGNQSQMKGTYIQRAYRFLQGGGDGRYVEFPFDYTMIKSGLLVVTALCNKDTTRNVDGDVELTVYDNNNNILYTKNLSGGLKRYEIPLTNNSGIKVRFTANGVDKDCECVIYSIMVYDGTNVKQITLNDTTSVFGASWTQFSSGEIKELFFPNGEDNAVIKRPDGTTGDGCGYFSKELARAIGENTPNWGKSGSTTSDWGLPMIDFVISHYSRYCVFLFIINDRTILGENGFETWKANLKKMAKKCRRVNVQPIVCIPCCTNSEVQTLGLGRWHEQALKGWN